MRDFLVNIWIIIEKDGIIVLVYCLDCKVGLGEICFYVVSVLFYIEVIIWI